MRITKDSPKNNPKSNQQNEEQLITGILKNPNRANCPKGNKKVRFKNINKKTRTRKSKSNIQKVSKKCNIMYVNANGITGKINSLNAAAKVHNSHIIAVTETKTTTDPPKLDGFEWITKNRKGRLGGGVAIAIRQDIVKSVSQVLDLEDQNQEVLWIELKHGQQKTFIGTYYGRQENATKEDVETEFSQLNAQINKLKDLGQVILTGDFNAKINIEQEHCKQQTSRNGKLLETLIKNTDMKPISVSIKEQLWTRVNRKRPNEKSVIDYILVTEGIEKKATDIHIDQQGLYRLKGKQESDHNTITLSADLRIKKDIKKMKKVCTNNKEGWKQFNYVMKEKHDTAPCQNYEELQNRIVETIEETVGIKTITISNNKKWEPPETKELRKNKREARRKLNLAIKKNSIQKQEALNNYQDAQWKLKTNITQNEAKRTKDAIEKLTKACQKDMNEFWKQRKKMLGKSDDSMVETLTEDGCKIEDPEKEKEHIAQYCENLYQARPGKPEYKAWTEKIENYVREVNETLKEEPSPPPITKKEMDDAIKTLKRNKAVGPDGIPNEALIEANKDTRDMYLQVMNTLLKKREPPLNSGRKDNNNNN